MSIGVIVASMIVIGVLVEVIARQLTGRGTLVPGFGAAPRAC